MRNRYGIAVVLGLFTGLLGFSSSAGAQDSAGLEPNGVPLGGFRLYPTLALGASYDDNIYRTQSSATPTVSDYYFSEMPGFTLQSQWDRHKLDLYASMSAYQYAKRTHESHVDYNAGADGQLDIHSGVDLAGGGSYSILHESRTSPDQPLFARTPTQYALTQANAVLEYRPYHFGFSVGGTYARYNYSPTQTLPLVVGGPVGILPNDDRNRNEYVGYVKGSYEFSPGYAAFVQANYRDVTYQTNLVAGRRGYLRNNNGYSINAGLDMLVTNLIKGEVFAGYLNEHYHTGTFPSITGFNFGANVEWDASPLWTVYLTASRQLNGTTIGSAASEDDQTVRLGVDYRLLTNLLVQGHVGYTDSNFKGSGRDDKITDAGIGLNYLMNRLVTATLTYDYQTRDSSPSASKQNFNDNVVSVGLNFHV